MEFNMLNRNEYLKVLSHVESAHRHFLEMVKLELEALNIHDINNVQGLMLFNIGDAKMNVGELTLRGCYHGSNVSYNVKKMVENSYLSQERSAHDRRSFPIRLTDKGVALRDLLLTMHQRHLELLAQTAMTEQNLQETTVTLRRLERNWTQPEVSLQRRDQVAA
jgi:DNA-binding MarR family transcriptional regulator